MRSLRRQRTTVHLMLAIWHINSWNTENQTTSGDLHVVQYGLTINMDKTASDYSKVSANIEASTAMIYDMARNIIGSYTYTEVIDGETTTNKIKEELLKQLKETFNTECIYSVSFYNWVAQ